MRIVTEIPKLNQRPVDGHKGMFGKICIAGGSLGYSGAPALAGMAALRSGAGLVRLAVPASIIPIVAAINPCYTTVPLAEDVDGIISHEAAMTLREIAEQNDVTAFGPGAAVTPGVEYVLLTLLAVEGLRLIIDADGINILSKCSGPGGWLEQKKASLILTPHPGEFRRLWNSCFRSEPPRERSEQAAGMARHTGCVVVLKGAGTVVADDKRLYVNTTGNPGMATAGAGDVLTGVIAALAGQGLDNFDAAALGVYVHGLAGDLAAENKGQISITATDIIDYLPNAFLSRFCIRHVIRFSTSPKGTANIWVWFCNSKYPHQFIL